MILLFVTRLGSQHTTNETIQKKQKKIRLRKTSKTIKLQYQQQFNCTTTIKMFKRIATRQAGALRQQIRLNHHKAELPPWAFEKAYPVADKKAAQAFKEQLSATQHHAEGTSSLWRKISYFVALPAIVATAINTYFVEAEHAEHRAHLAHVSDEDWPIQYDYQNIRTKNFFWGDGDKTLFWNPVINRHVKHD